MMFVVSCVLDTQKKSMALPECAQIMMTVHGIQKQNAAKQKELQSKFTSSKEEMLAYMCQSQTPFVQVNDEYICVVHKTSKPPINADFLSASFLHYLRINNLHPNPDKTIGDTFAKFVTDLQSKLSTTTPDLKICGNKPVSTMIANALM